VQASVIATRTPVAIFSRFGWDEKGVFE